MFGTVFAATNELTRQVVGVKRLKRTSENARAIDLEIEVYTRIGMGNVSTTFVFCSRNG